MCKQCDSELTQTVYEWVRDQYKISTDTALLNVDFLHQFLSYTYWSPGISKEKIIRKIKNSICFGLYEGKNPIGFARVVSDFVSVAYLADVFVIESHRGRKLAKWLITAILAHPDLQNLKLWMLRTRDAHGLYRQVGFTDVNKPETMMEILTI